MKRIIPFLIFMALIFICLRGCKFEAGESMDTINNEYTPYITINDLTVYEINKNYLVTIDGSGIDRKLVGFSNDRKCWRMQGIDLIKSDDINQFLNISFSQLTEKIGRPHADIGSGFYIPAYVTEDAYLICFQLEDQVVIEVIKRDLLTNRIVDRISA